MEARQAALRRLLFARVLTGERGHEAQGAIIVLTQLLQRVSAVKMRSRQRVAGDKALSHALTRHRQNMTAGLRQSHPAKLVGWAWAW